MHPFFHLFYVTGAIIWGSLGMVFLVSILATLFGIINGIWDLNRRKMTILYQLWEAQRVYFLYILKNDVGHYDRRVMLDICSGIKREKRRMTWVRNLYARVIRKVRKSNSFKEYNNTNTKSKNTRKSWNKLWIILKTKFAMEDSD